MANPSTTMAWASGPPCTSMSLDGMKQPQYTTLSLFLLLRLLFSVRTQWPSNVMSQRTTISAMSMDGMKQPEYTKRSPSPYSLVLCTYAMAIPCTHGVQANGPSCTWLWMGGSPQYTTVSSRSWTPLSTRAGIECHLTRRWTSFMARL